MVRATTIMSAAARRWLWCAAVVAVAACGSASGGTSGGSTAQGDGGGGTVASLPSVTPQQCSMVSKVQVPRHPLTVLVVDNTASGPAGTNPLPGSVTTALQQAQAKEGALVILGVNGAGRNPLLVKEIALDPDPGHTSRDADSARAIAIGCVAQWASTAVTRPAEPGSDILSALDAAIRRAPAQIIVMSDGLDNVDPLDLNKIGYGTDPASVVASLRNTKSVDHATGQASVLWADLGVTSRPIPDAVRDSVKQLWTAILRDAGLPVTFAPDETEAAPVPPQAPADMVKLPAVTTTAIGCHTTVTIPADLLFRPGDWHLTGASGVLAQARGDLSESGSSAVISGHTAEYGSPAYRHQLSIARAQAVARALESEGVSKSRLKVVGDGSARPAENEFPSGPGGPHDLAAAAANRRVVIDITRGECG